jgi:hypothetical protein
MRRALTHISPVVARTFSLCALLTVTVVLLGPGTSHGQATVGSFQNQRPFSETVTNYPCFEGSPVTMTGTITSVGRFTEVDERHVRVHGTDTIDCPLAP